MNLKSSNGGQMGIFWGESTETLSMAIKNAAAAANKSLPGKTLEWLEVAEIRGGFKDNTTLQFQVSVRIGYA
ncbi:MAG TPA: dodecin domain-containing protein [Fibrobacteria bacterium]|nr:dodecin domain-containing protein [Fibrobacteria bacterium]